MMPTTRPSEPQQRTHIFRLAPPRLSQRTVFQLARQFGLKGNLKTGSLCQDARQMSYSEGSLELVLHHASGGLRFHDKARWQVDDGAANVEFDDATAVDMARRFIEQLSVVPLVETKVLRVTRLNVGVVERRTGLGEQRVIDVGVAFARVVEGHPVEGPGGKVMVYIDHKGELTGIDRVWREVQEVDAQDVELRSAEAVREEAVREWGEPGSGGITIDDTRFGYFEDGWDVAQRYLQPAYFVDFTITATEGHFAGPVMRSQYWGAAAIASPESLVPPRHVIQQQARRQQYVDPLSGA
jgi:hypothetical protein